MNYNPDHAAISIVGDFNSKESCIDCLVFKMEEIVKEEEIPPKRLSPKKAGYYS
jgi:hypothetical protein